ncbi:type II toxin-antitoxin system PemK/MazF family toxin [Helicobacter marmotae]|nr:type II toxin-antitoxin system PemK/MazF family toxin [Helicobacter marmotae]
MKHLFPAIQIPKNGNANQMRSDKFERFGVYWVNLEPVIGSEIAKTRPCVIISPDELNYLSTRIVAPITSKGFDAPFRLNITLEGKKARILCDQIRTLSIKRFSKKITTLSHKDSARLLEILQEFFA